MLNLSECMESFLKNVAPLSAQTVPLDNCVKVTDNGMVKVEGEFSLLVPLASCTHTTTWPFICHNFNKPSMNFYWITCTVLDATATLLKDIPIRLWCVYVYQNIYKSHKTLKSMPLGHMYLNSTTIFLLEEFQVPVFQPGEIAEL